MSGFNKTEQTWLQEKFGDFVNFDRNERVLYNHDIAAMPGLFTPLIGNIRYGRSFSAPCPWGWDQ